MSLPPPPQGFRPCDPHTIVRVELLREGPPLARAPRKRKRGAFAAGLRYERRAIEYLRSRYPREFAAHPWFRFRTHDAPVRWAQPDGLIVDFFKGRITIIEIKLKHTTDAWWQTRRLYEPLVRYLFGERQWHYACCEVVRWYDPAIRVPEHVVFTDDPSKLYASAYGIHIFGG